MVIASHRVLFLLCAAVLVAGPFSRSVLAQDQDGLEYITSEVCADCHETSNHGTDIEQDLSHSIHEDLECQDCHSDKKTVEHVEDPDFIVGSDGCRSCHEKESEEYQAHGRAVVHGQSDIPQCSDCHGSHGILPAGLGNNHNGLHGDPVMV